MAKIHHKVAPHLQVSLYQVKLYSRQENVEFAFSPLQWEVYFLQDEFKNTIFGKEIITPTPRTLFHSSVY